MQQKRVFKTTHKGLDMKAANGSVAGALVIYELNIDTWSSHPEPGDHELFGQVDTSGRSECHL